VSVVQAHGRHMHARAGTGLKQHLRAAHAPTSCCKREPCQRLGLTAHQSDAPCCAPPQVPLAWTCNRLRARGLLPAWASKALVLATAAFGQAAGIVLSAQAAA